VTEVGTSVVAHRFAPEASVVVVTWNSVDRVGRCLASVARCVDLDSTDVVVIDNGSDDGTATFVTDRFPWAEVVANGSNLGFPRAVNQGVRLTSGRYVVFLNPDAWLGSDAIASLRRVFDRHPDAGAVGPRIVREDGRTDDFAARAFPALGNATLRWLGFRRLAPGSRWLGRETIRVEGSGAVSVPCLTGAMLMVPRDLLGRIGMLDETIPMYLEDLELCRRIRAVGRSVYFDSGTTVMHEGGASTAKSRHRPLLKATENGHAPWLFIGRWQGAWQARLFVAVVALGSLLRVVWHGARAVARRAVGREAHDALIEMRDNVGLLRWSLSSKSKFDRRLHALFGGDPLRGGTRPAPERQRMLERAGRS